MKILFCYAFHPNSGYNTSPFTITTHLFNYLSERAQVIYCPWDSHTIPEITEDTILVGHPHYDPNTIVQQIFRQDIPMAAKYSIHPLHTVRVEDNWPFNHIAKKADGIFSICGPYWYDTIEDTLFKDWKSKITRLDMAVDCGVWKYRKTRFNEPGKRGVVYVGSSMPQKNLGYFQQIASLMPGINFRWYGGSGDHPMSRLPNVQIFGRYDFPNDEIMNDMYDFGDIFLNVSISDANPTTILEFGLAGGLIPICTQTSGYWNDPSFINIPHDAVEAARIIRHWLQSPSEELEKLSASNREVCQRDYTWEKFCTTIWKTLEKHF